MKRVETESEFDSEAADIVVQQVMEQLVEVKLDDLLAYTDTLDNNHSLRDEPPFTRYEVCGVITRCLTLYSDVCKLMKWSRNLQIFRTKQGKYEPDNSVPIGTRLQLNVTLTEPHRWPNC